MFFEFGEFGALLTEEALLLGFGLGGAGHAVELGLEQVGLAAKVVFAKAAGIDGSAQGVLLADFAADLFVALAELPIALAHLRLHGREAVLKGLADGLGLALLV